MQLASALSITRLAWNSREGTMGRRARGGLLGCCHLARRSAGEHQVCAGGLDPQGDIDGRLSATRLQTSVHVHSTPRRATRSGKKWDEEVVPVSSLGWPLLASADIPSSFGGDRRLTEAGPTADRQLKTDRSWQADVRSTEPFASPKRIVDDRGDGSGRRYTRPADQSEC